MEQKVFNINFIILIEKTSKLIRSLLNSEVLGLNGILNKVFKMVILVIIKDLAKTVNYYFANRIILKSLKIFIIVVLYKKGKKNYSLLSSYKPIIFKNMLVKVLKKYVANIMLKVVEKYKLFL